MKRGTVRKVSNIAILSGLLALGGAAATSSVALAVDSANPRGSTQESSADPAQQAQAEAEVVRSRAEAFRRRTDTSETGNTASTLLFVAGLVLLSGGFAGRWWSMQPVPREHSGPA